MKQELTDLQSQVEETVGVEASAAALIGSLKDKLAQAIKEADWSAVQALHDKLDTSEQALAAAVAANSEDDEAEESEDATS